MEDLYTRIEDYLLHELDPAERQAFEAALRTDPQLAAAVAARQQVMQGLETLAIRKKVQQALQPRRQSGVVLVMATLASLLLLVLALFVWRRPSPPVPPVTPTATPAAPPVSAPAPSDTKPEVKKTVPEPIAYADLARKYYRLPQPDQVRGDAPARESLQYQAEKAFFEKKYTEVARLLADDNMVKNDETLRYLRAHARFCTEKYAAAAADFQALDNSFQYRFDARWLYVLSMVAQGKQQDKSVQQRLGAFAKDADFPYQKQAQTLLQQLNQ
jgi:hypothetical protein